jgi:glycosyltransferase involved in cell wall biosynthesis
MNKGHLINNASRLGRGMDIAWYLSMKIAVISPLFESVPPSGYGGTERVVSHLAETLVQMNHHVTLFASGDSITSAELVAAWPESLRKSKVAVNPIIAHSILMERVFERAPEFDILHFHTDLFQYPLAKRQTVPFVSTQHGRLDLPELIPMYREYRGVPVSSISRSQRTPLPWLNWVGNILHGIPSSLYKPNYVGGNYLAFLGRISPEKGVERAIEISRRAGLVLKIAAKIDKADEDYYSTTIKPLLARSPHVDFIGEIGDHEKSEFLGSARALLFPIDWPEPFGLVMIEALACATPVIAFRRGSVPEVLENGITGLIVDNIDSAVKAVSEIENVDRRRCREEFEKNFSSSRMANDYLKMYLKLVEGGKHGTRDRRHHSGSRSVLRPGDLVAS